MADNSHPPITAPYEEGPFATASFNGASPSFSGTVLIFGFPFLEVLEEFSAGFFHAVDYVVIFVPFAPLVFFV